MKSFIRVILYACIVIILSACGGNGSSDRSPSQSQNQGSNSPTNAAPIAKIDSVGETFVGTKVRLNGSSSTDPEGKTLSYTWKVESKPAGSTAILFADNVSYYQTTLTPDIAGQYVISLVVNDGFLSSAVSSVSFQATNKQIFATQSGCPSYFSSTSLGGWYYSYGSAPRTSKLDIVRKDGSIIQNVRLGDSGPRRSVMYENDLKPLVKQYPNEYLRFTCTYTQGKGKQEFSYQHPISDPEIWKPTSIDIGFTTAYFEISMIGDMQNRLWMKLMAFGRSESEAWIESKKIISESFGNVQYGPITNNENLVIGGPSVTELAYGFMSRDDQPNGRAYRRLKNIAELNTAESEGDVQSIISTAVEDYFNSKYKNIALQYPSITGAVFRQLTKSISIDPQDFGQSSWRSTHSSDAAFETKSKINIDGSWEASLNWVSGTSSSDFTIQKYQTVTLPLPVDYKKLFVDFSLLKAFGGCDPGLFGCTVSSGFAGVFVCYYDGKGDYIGCSIFSAVSDLVQLSSNVLGAAFKASNPFNVKTFDIFPIKSNGVNTEAFGLERTTSLHDLFNSSSVSNIRNAIQTKSIAKLEIGAAIAVTSNGCYKCKAEIGVKRLGVLAIR